MKATDLMSDVREVTSCVEALAVSSVGVLSVSAVLGVTERIGFVPLSALGFITGGGLISVGGA